MGRSRCHGHVEHLHQGQGSHGRGEPNRAYKEPNLNPNILSLVYVSYNRIRIVRKGIRFLINQIRILDFCVRFKRNRIDDFNQIIRLIRISEFLKRILINIDRIIWLNRIMSNFSDRQTNKVSEQGQGPKTMRFWPKRASYIGSQELICAICAYVEVKNKIFLD